MSNMTAEELLNVALGGDPIVGGRDYVGDDDDDDDMPFMGADSGPQVQRRGGKRPLLRLVIPFTSPAAIGAGLAGQATNKPQFKMRVDRIAIPASLTASFVVNSISIGQMPIFTANGSLHADLLSSAAFGVALSGWTCEAALDITFAVTNISAAAATFYAGIFGPTVVNE